MAEVPDSPRGVLVICDGGFEGMEYELTRGETIIGRNPTTDITLLDENISREHTIIVFDEELAIFSIEDLQSTNGTKVNGKRVRSAILRHEDRIEIGQTEFKFLIRGGPVAIDP